VVKAAGPGQQKVVAHIEPGGFLGEMSLIDGKQRFASCISTQPTDFAVLTRQALSEILVDHPPLGSKLLILLLQLMTARLRDAVTKMLPTIDGEWL
jgi:CRP-like cAMP-binding protein